MLRLSRLRCPPGEGLDEELFIELGKLSGDGGHKQLFGYGVEEPQVSGGVVGKRASEGIAHEVRGARLAQGVLDIVEELVLGEGLKVEAHPKPGAEGNQCGRAESFRQSHVSGKDHGEKRLGVEVGAG